MSEFGVSVSQRRQSRTADAAEFEKLFAACEGRLGRYLAQLIDDRGLAEDLLQDTFLAGLRAKQNLDQLNNPEAWLFGIARNRALNALRKRRRLHSALARLRARPEPAEDDAELVALRELLARVLTSEDRALVVLRYLHGFDSADLAEMTGLSREAVRQRLSRDRTRLLAASRDTQDLTENGEISTPSTEG